MYFESFESPPLRSIQDRAERFVMLARPDTAIVFPARSLAERIDEAAATVMMPLVGAFASCSPAPAMIVTGKPRSCAMISETGFEKPTSIVPESTAADTAAPFEIGVIVTS